MFPFPSLSVFSLQFQFSLFVFGVWPNFTWGQAQIPMATWQKLASTQERRGVQHLLIWLNKHWNGGQSFIGSGFNFVIIYRLCSCKLCLNCKKRYMITKLNLPQMNNLPSHRLLSHISRGRIKSLNGANSTGADMRSTELLSVMSWVANGVKFGLTQIMKKPNWKCKLRSKSKGKLKM